jgi:tRNA nucleotidyltransferase (CCA-adding enzyme)
VNRTKILEKIKKQKRSVWAIVFERPDVIDDILYPQLRRFQDNMLSFLRHNEFMIEDSWIFGDKECGMAFEVLTDELPNYRVIRGPRIFDAVIHQERFWRNMMWCGSKTDEWSQRMAENTGPSKTLWSTI